VWRVKACPTSWDVESRKSALIRPVGTFSTAGRRKTFPPSFTSAPYWLRTRRALPALRKALARPKSKKGGAARLPTINLYATGGLAARPHA